MQKSIHSREYREFVTLLREIRKEAGMTQIELAEALGETQSFISKCERGELRLDFIQLRSFCIAMGTTVPDLSKRFETRIKKRR